MNNPPAFPRPIPDFALGSNQSDSETSAELRHQGMTLRDYFAAAALPMIYSQVMNGGKDIQTLGSDYIANCSYILADAMLKAREQ